MSATKAYIAHITSAMLMLWSGFEIFSNFLALAQLQLQGFQIFLAPAQLRFQGRQNFLAPAQLRLKVEPDGASSLAPFLFIEKKEK